MVNLDDTSSYQPIGFTPIIKSYTTVLDDSVYSKDFYRSLTEKIEHPDSINYWNNKLKEDSARFKPKWTGYSISHEFRAKNKFGALVKENLWFRLDSSLNVVSVTNY